MRRSAWGCVASTTKKCGTIKLPTVLSQKLAKLNKLACTLGFKVVRGNSNLCTLSNRTISINFRQSQANTIFSLAHEIGHAKTLDACAKEFGYTRAIVQDNSFSGRESEFRAWCVADSLVKKLKLFGSAYVKYKHACLCTYYMHA